MTKKTQIQQYAFIAIYIIALLFSFEVNGQDVHFSQLYNSPLTLNPALCGSFDGDLVAEVNYRNQWASALGSGYGFSTMAADLQKKNIIKSWTNGYLSPGISFFSDKAGDIQLTNTEINGTIAGGVTLDKFSQLKVGLQGGWAQTSINLQNVSWDEQYINGHYDPAALTGEPVVGNSHSYSDFSGGMSYSYNSILGNDPVPQFIKYDLGMAFYHINEPNISYFNVSTAGTHLYIRYVLHGQVEFKTTSMPFSIQPLFIVLAQGPAQEIDFGAKINYTIGQQSRYTDHQKSSSASLGIYYRWNDSFIALLQLEFSSYAFGFSYDFNSSQYISATSGEGAFELWLRYVFKKTNKISLSNNN